MRTARAGALVARANEIAKHELIEYVCVQEGCTGYATLMDLRGEPGRAREYRERASLLASRRK